MKNKITEIIWWESCITEHQIHTLSELSKLPNIKLSVFAERNEDLIRKEQGWKECDWTLIDIHLIPIFKYRFIFKTLKDKKNCIHIFGGPFDSSIISFALFLSTLMSIKSYVLTEPYIPIAANLHYDKGGLRNWFLNKIRPLKYRILWTLLKSRVQGVFAISHIAIQQLLRFGINSDKIFPYAYFVPSSKSHSKNDASFQTSSDDLLRIIFVGTLNHRKGIDIAINVVNKINFLNKKVILDIYGPSNKTYDYAWSSHVRYKGLVPFGDVESTISKYDFLILPSRFDGWGVVINEALLARVPVICSNQAGASSLVKKWDCGACYDSTNESELEKLIEDICLNKEIMLNNFIVNLQKTLEVITPKIGAEFILSSIETEKNENKKNNWYV